MITSVPSWLTVSTRYTQATLGSGQRRSHLFIYYVTVFMPPLSTSVGTHRMQINLNEASWFELCGTCTFKVLMNQNQQHRKLFFLGVLRDKNKWINLKL